MFVGIRMSRPLAQSMSPSLLRVSLAACSHTPLTVDCKFACAHSKSDQDCEDSRHEKGGLVFLTVPEASTLAIASAMAFGVCAMARKYTSAEDVAVP